jgi:Calcipressin
MTPRPSRSSSTASRKSNLTLDLSDLPPLVQPTPPSNTLLFTNLNDPETFSPESLASIRESISRHGAIHAFAPLRSFRRILVSFFDEDAAIAVRRAYDGHIIRGDVLKIYFGRPTPLQAPEERLALPDAGKLFFISPPPSPPHDWEVRLEDAPNKLVHADDLAAALAQLNYPQPVTTTAKVGDAASPTSPVDGQFIAGRTTRSRSSTLIYQPDEKSPHMPAVVVEDMTDEPETVEAFDASGKPIMAHTSRPPVELMNDT